MIADSPLRRDGQFVHHVGLKPGSGLAYMRHGAGSHLITNNVAAWWRVILSFMRALTCCAPLVAGTLLGAWFCHRTQASHAVGLDRVEAGDGC